MLSPKANSVPKTVAETLELLFYTEDCFCLGDSSPVSSPIETNKSNDPRAPWRTLKFFKVGRNDSDTAW